MFFYLVFFLFFFTLLSFYNFLLFSFCIHFFYFFPCLSFLFFSSENSNNANDDYECVVVVVSVKMAPRPSLTPKLTLRGDCNQCQVDIEAVVVDSESGLSSMSKNAKIIAFFGLS